MAEERYGTSLLPLTLYSAAGIEIKDDQYVIMPISPPALQIFKDFSFFVGKVFQTWPMIKMVFPVIIFFHGLS